MNTLTGEELDALIEAEARATKGPWKWGDGYAEMDEKYADCRLLGPNESEVIPIRVDHRAPIWDTRLPHEDDDEIDRDNLNTLPCEADRDFIASLRNAAPRLLAEVKAAREVIMEASILVASNDGMMLDRLRAALSAAAKQEATK